MMSYFYNEIYIVTICTVFGGGNGEVLYYPNITDFKANPVTGSWTTLSVYPDIDDYVEGISDCYVHKSTIGDLFYMASIFPINGSMSSSSTHGKMIIFNMSNQSFVSSSDYSSTMNKPVLFGCTIGVSNENDNNNYNKVVKIGGYVYYEQMDFVMDNSIQIYDIDNDSWSMGPNLTIAVDEMGCHYHKNKIFIFGGIDTNGTYTRDIQL